MLFFIRKEISSMVSYYLTAGNFIRGYEDIWQAEAASYLSPLSVLLRLSGYFKKIS